MSFGKTDGWKKYLVCFSPTPLPISLQIMSFFFFYVFVISVFVPTSLVQIPVTPNLTSPSPMKILCVFLPLLLSSPPFVFTAKIFSHAFL